MKKEARAPGDRMISGKLRAKAGRSDAETSTLQVDGTEYAWSNRHGWVVWGKGIKAVSISVALHPGRTRELILDLTLRMNEAGGPPSERKVLRAMEAGIREAIESGWDPESRGRAFRYEVPEAI